MCSHFAVHTPPMTSSVLDSILCRRGAVSPSRERQRLDIGKHLPMTRKSWGLELQPLVRKPNDKASTSREASRDVEGEIRG